MPKTNTDFNVLSSQNILLQGPPGCGKTTLALQFPRPYLIDIDDNLAGAIQGINQRGIKFLWDTPLEDASGNRFDPLKDCMKIIDRFHALLNEAFTSDDVDTVIIDSATAVSNLFQDVIKKTNNIERTKAMEIQHWQPYIKRWLDLVTLAKAKPKRFILIGHEQRTKDDLDGGMKRMLNLPSQAAATIPGMFPDVWELYVKTQGKNHNYMIRVKQDNLVSGIKASNPSTPATFEATWENVAESLNIK